MWKPAEESEIYPYACTESLGQRIIVLAPHPDDESIGCGGTILKHTRKGSTVKVIFLTDGQKGDFEGRYSTEYTALRRRAAAQAMQTLGVKEYEFWGFMDRGLYLSERSVSERLLYECNTFRPDTILVPSPMEVHPDHKSTFRAVWRIRRKIKTRIILYEIVVPLYPDILIDITSEMQTKVDAIACYTTETYYNDYIEKTKGLNRFRTMTLPANVQYAEAFLDIHTKNWFFKRCLLSFV